ncbi:MAG: TlpA family protein disulfide reductase [Bryobacterales bacterium]|nr:TlpA family protein disulfide reductase [Bryobacterales bacterium]
MRRRDVLKCALPAAASAGFLQAATLPRPAPDIAINMPNSLPPIRLSQYKGKVIAVEFLLTYCSHCQRASRIAELVYRDYAGQGLMVVGAAINPGGDVAGYKRDHNLSFPVGLVTQDTCMFFMQHLPMARLLFPQVAFIDRNFNIVAQHSGDDAAFFGESEEKNLRALVERLMKAPTAPKKAAAKKKT